ncbi:FkbM family methyltransferase [Halovenus marina]|uniref:FkbM family methyltransferase n=1 Tax=Halovenus marina TaxID=3396621 RepID=UPI003F547B3A
MTRALVSHGRYTLAGYYLADLLTGGDRFRSHLEANGGDRYFDCDVFDFQLRVDLLDEGLSRDILIHGYREPEATARYRAELERLEAEHGGLTVVDVGANIGYFALLYPAQRTQDGTVIAIEPHPENISLLRENVHLNDFEDIVTCHQTAIGAETRSTTLQVSRHRNLCTTTERDTIPGYVGDIEVPVKRLDDLLLETGTALDTVDVLRMDVQGYEYDVFRGMGALLDAGTVKLAFLEIHPEYLRERGEYDAFLTVLQDAGFEVSFVADGRTAFLTADSPSYTDRPLAIDSFDELRDAEFTVEVLLRRQ